MEREESVDSVEVASTAKKMDTLAIPDGTDDSELEEEDDENRYAGPMRKVK